MSASAASIPFPAPTPGVIADVIELYLSDLDRRVDFGQVEDRHIAHQKWLLLNFAAHFGRLPLADAKQIHMTQWLAANPQWKKAASVRHGIYAVLSCFNWAVEMEIIGKNPYRKPRSLNLEVEPRPALEAKWYVAMLRAARRNRCFCRALFFVRRTGCRLKEMRELRRGQIDFEAAIARVPNKTHHKTGNATRPFGLDPCVLRLLGNLCRRAQGQLFGDAHEDGPLVFTNAKGEGWTKDSFGRRFHYWADKVGVPADQKAYALRHAFTVAAIEAGLSDRAIADQLGHSSTRMVSWYGRQTRTRTAHLQRVVQQALTRRRPNTGG